MEYCVVSNNVWIHSFLLIVVCRASPWDVHLSKDMEISAPLMQILLLLCVTLSADSTWVSLCFFLLWCFCLLSSADWFCFFFSLQPLAEAVLLADLDQDTVNHTYGVHLLAKLNNCCLLASLLFLKFICRLTLCRTLITHKRNQLCCQLVFLLYCLMELLGLR